MKRMRLIGNKPLIYIEVSDNSKEFHSTYVRVAQATSDVQSILEIPATDEIHMKDRNHGLAWSVKKSRTMAYTTRNTINSLAREELHLNPVVPERAKEK